MDNQSIVTDSTRQDLRQSVLKTWILSASAMHWIKAQAQLALHWAEGKDSLEIAKELDVAPEAVAAWKRLWCQQGEGERNGPTIGAEQELALADWLRTATRAICRNLPNLFSNIERSEISTEVNSSEIHAVGSTGDGKSFGGSARTWRKARPLEFKIRLKAQILVNTKMDRRLVPAKTKLISTRSVTITLAPETGAIAAKFEGQRLGLLIAWPVVRDDGSRVFLYLTGKCDLVTARTIRLRVARHHFETHSAT